MCLSVLVQKISELIDIASKWKTLFDDHRLANAKSTQGFSVFCQLIALGIKMHCNKIDVLCNFVWFEAAG